MEQISIFDGRRDTILPLQKTSHIHFRIITQSQHISSKVDLKQNVLQYLQYRQYCS